MRALILPTLALTLLACGGSGPKAPVKSARDRSIETYAAQCGTGPIATMTQYRACIATSARGRDLEKVKRWLKDRPDVRAGLARACDAERGPLAAQLKPTDFSACVTAARAEVLPREQWHDALAPICQRKAHGLEDVSVLDLNGLSNKPEGACDVLIKSDVLLPEERDTFLRVTCFRGAIDQCEALAGDRPTAANDSTRNWAADKTIGYAMRACPQGNGGACDILKRWAFRDPNGFASVLAQGRAAQKRIEEEEYRREMEEERQARAERREREREEEADREEREARLDADKQAMFQQTMQMMRDQQAWRDDQNRQAAQLMRRPAREPAPAPAPTPHVGRSSVQTAANGPSPSQQAAAAQQLQQQQAQQQLAQKKSQADKDRLFQACMARLPPETVPSRGDGFGVPEGAINAALSTVGGCTPNGMGLMGKACVDKVKGAIGSMRGGANLHGWAADMRRVAQRASALGSGPWMQTKPACSINDMHVASLNTWCFDSQQAPGNCQRSLQEALGDVRCAAQTSHWLDGAEAAADFARRKEQHATQCRAEAEK